ncbi:L-alanine-DL-glutamate epimerase [Litoreibacter ascidiaceicola]|uniref:Dipeptide epimerase n=1 Tax=Litoreibacter ascidiaceicola TaxID=1486859 RepID=A0A1M5AKD0_9RHOB|nr:N-acetyl-D-Glu racemase DgcA [Litoreibacter ascidiaceicola]SHF30709.1 L-alanine-DL-glutamate epimerase [Litoreibacter ascidiaceicola]
MSITVTKDVFQLAEVFTISRGSRTEAQVLTVRVERDGVVGQGECVPYARYGETLDSVIAEILSLPSEITRTALQGVLPAGAARNAVDCALWDWEAKKAGVRVWDLLGLPAPKPEITAYTLSLADPAAMEASARKHNHRPLLKIKLGTPDDMPRLEAVRRGAPDTPIIIDANEGWTADVYSDLAPHLVRLGVKLVEQPLPAGNDDMLAEIDRPLPVCADEACHDRASLPSLKGKYDVINIKLDKTGGLTEALALKDAGLAQGYGVMVGCMVGSSLAMAPATILAQGVAFTDLDGPLLLAEDRDEPLIFDEAGVHAPKPELWG